MGKTNYVDFSEIYKAVGKTKKHLEKAEREALIEAGEYAASKLKANTPYFNGTKYARGKWRQYDREHMKNHVTFSKPTKNKPSVEVGFDKDVSWRVHFLEFGTIKQRPQPFVKKTMKEIEDDVADIIQKEMRRRIGI